MNSEPVTAISEIVGAIAVVVTLVYLSRQIAMSNKFAEAEAWRSRFSEFTSLNAAYGVNPAFYHAMRKLHASFGMPNVREQWRFYRKILTSAMVEHLEKKYGLDSPRES